AQRGIRDGDVVRLFNPRGACLAGAVLDADVMPGVVVMATGAWFDPADATGEPERHGNPNVLTPDIATSPPPHRTTPPPPLPAPGGERRAPRGGEDRTLGSAGAGDSGGPAADRGGCRLGAVLLNSRRVQVLQIDEALGCGKRRLDRFALAHQGDDLFHSFEIDLA